MSGCYCSVRRHAHKKMRHDRDDSRHKEERLERWNGRATHNWSIPDTVYLNPDKISGQEKAAFFCNNSRLDIVTKSWYNDNRIEIMIYDVVTGGEYGNFI